MKQVDDIRLLMQKEGVDAYIVPTSDFHGSEYVGAYFKTREFMSGFTGSAGTLVITADFAGLWTDGRYFLQAGAQLEGSGIELMKMGEEGVPTVLDFLASELDYNQTIAFDGRMVGVSFGRSLSEKVASKNIRIIYDLDLVDRLWSDRPALSCEPAFVLSPDYCGKTFDVKLSELRVAMAEKNCSMHLLTSLDDIAWLLNVRGNDVDCNPVILSYMAITETEVIWFTDESRFDESTLSYLYDNEVELRPYNDVYEFAQNIPDDVSVLIDPDKLNYSLLESINKSAKVVESKNPTTLMKCIKNPTEIDRLRETNIKDGVAVTKFIYWLKNNVGRIPMTELSVSEKLLEFRKAQEDFIEISFDTIAGYGSNGAIVHYEPTPETDTEIRPEGFLLVDSGGQYLGGTTDITRTIVLGPVTEEMKTDYTAVLRGHIKLGRAKFREGVSGSNLDILAREPMWDANRDYNHGTGHGVGFLLNVHEGPQSFHWLCSPGRASNTPLKEGMVITDEPGIYITGSHGVRIENDVLVCKDVKNEYGQFMKFEHLTLAPIDLEAVNFDQMTQYEIQALNEYHQMVFEKLSPYLTEEEVTWLRSEMHLNM